jgi:REP element-mobilizing transposase RayT
MSRGNRKTDIFGDDGDRTYFLRLLDRVVEDRRWILHAYCLMTNHYHLVLTTPLGNVSAGMQWLNSMYATWFNWRYDLTGHLFGGRFHSEDIKTEAHLLQACRYVVLNPVRAWMCDAPAQYRWSSYNATVGTVREPQFLTVGSLLEHFGGAPDVARGRYGAFVAAGLEEALRVRKQRVPAGHGRGLTPAVAA